MGPWWLVERLVARLAAVRDNSDLIEALANAARDMGFRHFALSHHIKPARDPHGLRVHDYPAAWATEYEEKGLSGCDPIHRASQRSIGGFAWRDLKRFVAVSDRDRRMLERGRIYGLGDGYTVPANIPGEISGSCTFAVGPGETLPEDRLLIAQLVGTAALESARRLQTGETEDNRPNLTDRQRDCARWVAVGKSDWEISRILGISEETVIEHIKLARERYDVVKRTPLVVRALYDGHLSFGNIIGR